MTSPIISIIIPVYNAEKTLRRCLDSILNQTFGDYDILLINDGSQDQSLSLLREYEQTHNQIKVIDKTNEGAALTRNLGIELAKGDFIVFIDSDDFIERDYLKTYYNTIIRDNSDIVVGGYKQVSQDKERSSVVLPYPNDTWTPYLIMAPWAKMYRKQFLIDHRVRFVDYTMEDLYFNAVAYSKASKITVVDDISYCNVVNMESITHTLHKGIRQDVDILFVLDKIRQDVATTEYMTFFYKKSYLYYLLFSGKHSSPDEFLKEHERIMAWVSANQLQTTLSVFDNKLRAEPLKTRLIIAIFDVMEKVGGGKLLRLFARLYCSSN